MKPTYNINILFIYCINIFRVVLTLVNSACESLFLLVEHWSHKLLTCARTVQLTKRGFKYKPQNLCKSKSHALKLKLSNLFDEVKISEKLGHLAKGSNMTRFYSRLCNNTHTYYILLNMYSYIVNLMERVTRIFFFSKEYF